MMTLKRIFLMLLLALPLTTIAQDNMVEANSDFDDRAPIYTDAGSRRYSNKQTGANGFSSGLSGNNNSAGTTGSSSGSGPGFNGTVDDGCTVPLDGGMSLLLIAGVALAAWKYRDMMTRSAAIA